MDSFSFVTSGALEMPVNVKMLVVPFLLLGYSILTNQRRRGSLEGQQTPVPFSTLVQHPELRHIGSNQR
jgi:phosphatidylinositol 3-kinase